MSAQLALAQQDDSDGRDENKHTDDLKGQVVVLKKQQSDLVDIISCRSYERRKFFLGGSEISNDVKNLDQQSECDDGAAGGRYPVDLAQSFSAQIEEHDDEKEQHHDGAGIHQHLNDPNEVGVERHEERSQPEK